MSRKFKQVMSILLAAALLIPTGWFAPIAKAETPSDKIILSQSFEDGNTGGWGALGWAGQGTAVVSSDVASDGTRSLQFKDRADRSSSPSLNLTSFLKSGRTYDISFKARVGEGEDTLHLASKVDSPELDNTYPWLIGDKSVGATEWTLFELKGYKVPASTSEFIIWVEAADKDNDSKPKADIYIDEVLILDVTSQDSQDKVVYHETFESGIGIATPAGNAKLEPVSDIFFEGNDDGKAVYVSGRANNYDGIDIPFTSVGMENGKTYTITVTGYVYDTVDVLEGAQALLQNVDSYSGLYVPANYEAGKAFIMKGTYTVDKSKDRALRIQSNDDGAEVPFYIGDILITEKVSDEGSPRPPAKTFTTIDFEDQQMGGFEPRGDTEVLSVTDEANHTDGGSYALKVDNRTKDWHGPSLRVEQYIDIGHEYKISVWVKLIEPTSVTLQLSTQIGAGDGASYNKIESKTVSVEDGWVQLSGTYRYNSVGGEYVTIYIESPNSETASFYIDDISFESTGSGPTDIERDLIPLKDVYKDYFLIGNAVSEADLEGIRLELLTMHHNLVTAENAMKPGYAYDDEREFDFTAEDELVTKALAEGLQMHGHVLVWHEQSNEWLHSDENGKSLSRDEALSNLRTHIKTVVEHFGDKVISWDVVNEAMNDNPPNPSDWKGSLRQSGWYKAIGPSYIEESFRAAKEVLKEKGWDDIKLYYNDYNDDNQNKAEAIYQMVKEINENYAAENDGELLIDGIGMQGHYNLSTNPENVRRSLEKFISLGVEVGVTELDITAGSDNVLTDKQANQQAYLYAQLFQIYKEHAEHISRVTFWGLNDATSWRAAQSPLLFDKNLRVKLAYYAVIDPEKFIEEYDPDEVEVLHTTARYGTPTIDGEIDAVWSQAEEIPINRYQTAWNGAHGIARALWDENNLYVLIEVIDSELDKSNDNAWEQDSIEVFLDQNNAKTTYYQEDDGQYRVNFDNETSFNPESIAEGFESATKVMGTNYTVEVKIPLTAITPTHDTKLGFDVQINDAKDGNRRSVAIWNDLSGVGYQDTSVFGTLTLIKESRGGGNSGIGWIPSAETVVTSPDGVVTIKPVLRTVDGRTIATITSKDLQRALELAVSQSNGKRHIVVELPDADQIDVQLPTESLQGEEDFVLLLKTAAAIVEVPSNMLSNMTIDEEQVSIRIDKASMDGLDAAVREQIGNRPAIDLNLIVDGNVITWNNPDAPVTVSIPYTPNAEEQRNLDHIVVWHIDSQGGITTIPNGRYDAASEMVIFRTTHFSTFAVTSVFKTFGDLQSVPWAKEAIEVMASRDIIRGTGDGHYTPTATIKRADFIALLVRALELQGTVDNEVMFDDVPASAYYYGELRIAKELGIALGTGDNKFKPDASISRQDMMVLTARALSVAGKQLDASGSLSAYPDASSISDYAKNSVTALVNSGIIIGKGGGVAPHDSLTRAEAAVILYRIWNL